MAFEYRFLDRDDESLIRTSELPVEDGIAVAVLTAGYAAGEDEVVELSIADLGGNVLFTKRVKPQNAHGEFDPAASGGITAADVADAAELFQFEDEIDELFENASIVVGQHVEFACEAIESSWVTLPAFDGFDLLAEFCASHCASDYPARPAAVVTLRGIADYYGAPCDEADTAGIAATVAACYVKLVDEHAAERVAKGPEYWAEYDRKAQEAARADQGKRAAERERAKKTLLMNALLWLCGAAVFGNAAVQTRLNGFDFGFTVVTIAAAVFCVVRWGMCLYGIRRLRR